MNKQFKYTFYTTAAATAILAGFAPLALATNSGSVKTVLNCGNVNDNQFNVGDQVLGKGENFDTNSDYRWTIEKVDQPGKNTQIGNGAFSLINDTSFCMNLTTAVITAGDTHSEYKWEVERKETDKHGNTNWKKVDSDNFFVDSANQTQPTATPTYAPTATPTVVPTSTPTPTVTPTTAPTATPTPTSGQTTPTPTTGQSIDESESIATPTPTAGAAAIAATATPTNSPAAASSSVTSTPTSTPTQDILSSGASTVNTEAKVQGIQATLGASKMANTGAFENTLMNTIFAFGLMVMSLGLISYSKEK